jgi:hypothetical protein
MLRLHEARARAPRWLARLAALGVAVGCTVTACAHNWDSAGPPVGGTSTGTSGGDSAGDGGSGGASCSPPAAVCGGDCADLATDPKHCGGCDVVCGPGETCQDSACRCAEGEVQDIGSVVPQLVNGSTVGQPDTYALSCAMNASDQVFRFTAPAAGTYTFDAVSSAEIGIGLYSTNTCQEVACDHNPASFEAKATSPLAAGEAVQIVVSGAGGTQSPFDLRVAVAEGSCSPRDIGSTVPQTVTDTTVGAIDGLTPVCAMPGSPEVVFAFTAPQAGVYDFNTEGSTFDTVLEIRDESCTGPSLACDDDSGASSNASWATAQLNAGQTVFIVIDGYETARGPCTLNISLRPPAVCNPILLPSTVPQTVMGSTAGRTSAVDGSCSEPLKPDVVYDFTAPTTGTYTLDTDGSLEATALYVLSERCDGQELACNRNIVTGTSRLQLQLSAGQRILIVIDGLDAMGEYRLHIQN